MEEKPKRWISVVAGVVFAILAIAMADCAVLCSIKNSSGRNGGPNWLMAVLTGLLTLATARYALLSWFWPDRLWGTKKRD
ncbi:MAG: hypothetical protein K8T25_23440 [Planctomycetia bacterium]|nr:hypothetical protein [Planctomycetia bacterium]